MDREKLTARAPIGCKPENCDKFREISGNDRNYGATEIAEIDQNFTKCLLVLPTLPKSWKISKFRWNPYF